MYCVLPDSSAVVGHCGAGEISQFDSIVHSWFFSCRDCLWYC